MPNSPIHEQRSESDASMGDVKTQSPKCLGIPMRAPTKIQLQAPPAHQWELRLPGLPFEVHVCDSGRWVITSGRDSVAYGNEGERDRAAAKAQDVILGWGAVIQSMMPTTPVEPEKPFEHPMAAKVEEHLPAIREPIGNTTNKKR